MSSHPPAEVIIARDDLETLAQIAMLRFPLRAPESRRLERTRALLTASAELCRALGTHTHCALVNCHGTHGIGDLEAETDAFYAALSRYAALVGEIADEYRRFTVEGPYPDLIPEAAPRLEVA